VAKPPARPGKRSTPPIGGRASPSGGGQSLGGTAGRGAYHPALPHLAATVEQRVHDGGGQGFAEGAGFDRD
jgi:hypothetical protein